MSEATLAVLNMAIKAGEAETAAQHLERLTRAANDVDAAFGRAGKSAGSSSSFMGTSASQAQKTIAQLAKEQERATKQAEIYERRVNAVAKALDPLAAVQITLTERTKLFDEALAKGGITAGRYAELLGKATAAARAGEEQIGRYGATGRQTTQMLGQLSFQLNDVVTGLASGQKPFQILAQQGGQIFQALQMGPGGVGGSLKALTGLLNPVTIGVTALAVGFGGLAIAAYDAEKRTASFGALAKGVGQDLGLNGGQLQDLAKASAAASQSSIRDAEDWTQAYVRMGLNNTGVLSRAVTDTKALAKALGVDGAAAAEVLGAALVDPIANLDALAKKTGGFDEKLKENIQSLARHGDLAQAEALILAEVERRAGGAAAGVDTLSGSYDRLKTSIGNYLSQAAKLVFTNPSQMQVAQTYSGFGYNPILQNAADAKATAARDNQNDALGSAARSAFDSLLPKVQQIKVIQDKQTALQNALNAAQAGNMGALTAANLTTAQARDAINAGNKQIADLKKDKAAAAADRKGAAAASRAVRAGNAGDNAIEQAKAAELTAQLATTRNVEAIAGIKAAQIAQELTTQKVRLAGLVEEKRVTDADAKTALASYERVAGYKRQALDLEAANQIAQRDLQYRQDVLGYTQRVAQLQAAAAPSMEQAFAIEAKALAERQAYDRDALQESIAQRVVSGEVTLTRGKLLLVEQRIAQAADAEDQQRQKRLAIFDRDLDIARQVSQSEADILGSRKGLAQSAYEAAQLDRQIEAVRYAARKDELSKVIANADVNEAQHGAAVRDLATLEAIHANNLRALDLSANMATAYADLVGALSNAARSVIDGDIGGSISATGGVLSQLSGLAKGSALSGALATAASYAGPIGAAVSAVTGVLGAIGDRSAAKAEKKIAELTKTVDDLRTENKTSSGSIAAALAQANSNWNADLEYSSAMLDALRSIDAKTGAVAALVARQISTGGLLDTKGLGVGSTSSQGSVNAGLLTGAGAFGAIAGGTGLLMGGFAGALALGPMGLVAGAVGALVGALMKTKSTTEVLDQGLQFTASTFDQIAMGGVSGSSYADLLTTTKKSLLGVGLSTKVKTSTVTGGIDPDLLGQVTGVVQALGDGVLASASVFGVEAAKVAESALGSAVVDLGKLSLKDLKPDEIASVLNAAFDKVGDQLAAAGVPGLDKLASVGEGSFETLTRLAREYQVIDVSLASLSKTFGLVGVGSLAARDALVQATGGIEAFVSQTAFFATNFLTDAERLAPVIKAVNDNLKAYGLSAESGRDQFKGLVLAQDLATEAGRNTYAALMAVAPAFDKVAKASEESAAASASKAKEVADLRMSWQDKIDELTLSSSDLAVKARQREAAAALAVDATIGPLVQRYYDLQDAQAAAAKEVEAQSAAATAWNEQLRLTTFLTDQATKAAEAQAAQLSDLASGFQDAIKNAQTLGETISAFIQDLLGELGPQGQAQSYEQQRAALMSGQFDPEKAKAFLASSKDYNTTTGGYQADVALVRALGQGAMGNLANYPASLSQLAQGMAQDQAEALQRARSPYNTAGVFPYVGGVAPTIQAPVYGSNDNAAVIEQLQRINDRLSAVETNTSSTAASTGRTAKATENTESTLRNVTDGGEAMKQVSA